MLDQHPDGDLVRQPDVRAGQPAIGDLPAQHLEVLGDARRQPVAELLVGVEPLELVVRAGHLERGPRDLRGARQGRGGARVEQPRPAPHERDEEQLGHRVQVQRQQRAVAVRRRLGCGGLGRDGPPVPPGNRDRDLQPVVHHGARAHGGRPRAHEPAAGRLPVAFHAGQPDPVAVARDVESVRPAYVRDPRAFGCRGDDSGSPGEPAPGRNRQVDFWSPPEYQLASLGEPDDLARRCADVCGHRASLELATRGRDPRIRGWRAAGWMRLAPGGGRRSPSWKPIAGVRASTCRGGAYRLGSDWNCGQVPTGAPPGSAFPIPVRRSSGYSGRTSHNPLGGTATRPPMARRPAGWRRDCRGAPARRSSGWRSRPGRRGCRRTRWRPRRARGARPARPPRPPGRSPRS